MTAAATFCATLVDEWVRAGVTDAVVAPGSRSTPVALALAAEARLRLHVHHDERSAAFLALGLGRATGRPAVVVTTSGTATVELHPAVVEASHDRVPLLAVTADRPPELRDVGAAQTIDQQHLYGRSVRWFADPGVPDEAAAPAWRSLAARSVAECLGPPPGPVQLNLPFREPLVGEPGPLPPGRADGGPWHAVAAAAPAPLPPVVLGRRTIVVSGGTAVDATALGVPVLADPRSRRASALTVAAFDALLRSPRFAERARPERVLRLGPPPASKVLSQWLAASGAETWVLDEGWTDPDRLAARVLRDGRELAAWAGPTDEAWVGLWQRAEAVAQGVLGRALPPAGVPTEPAVARTLVDALPAGATLVVSSSMPVRDVEWYGCPRSGLRVLSNRGANGIDGVVSTAVGVALADPAAPTALLVGDVAFLHDTNGLLGLARRRPAPDLAIVVVDNDGGGIFSFLPQAAALPAERFELLFGTPHGVDPLALAAAHGVPGREVGDLSELAAAVAPGQGPRVVRVRVRTDRSENVRVHTALHRAVADALDAQLLRP